MGYLGTISDITDRHTAEEQVRRTGALLRGVLDNAPYIVVVTSSDGVIWDFNRGAEKHLGYSSNEAIGQVAVELLHDPDELKAMATRLSREFRATGIGWYACASEREWHSSFRLDLCAQRWQPFSSGVGCSGNARSGRAALRIRSDRARHH